MPDDSGILTGSADHTARLWYRDKSDEALKFGAEKDSDQDIVGHTARINGMAVSTDSLQLVTVGDDNRAILWNLKTADRLCHFDMESKILCVTMADVGGMRRIVMGGECGGLMFVRVSGSAGPKKMTSLSKLIKTKIKKPDNGVMSNVQKKIREDVKTGKAGLTTEEDNPYVGFKASAEVEKVQQWQLDDAVGGSETPVASSTLLFFDGSRILLEVVMDEPCVLQHQYTHTSAVPSWGAWQSHICTVADIHLPAQHCYAGIIMLDRMADPNDAFCPPSPPPPPPPLCHTKAQARKFGVNTFEQSNTQKTSEPNPYMTFDKIPKVGRNSSEGFGSDGAGGAGAGGAGSKGDGPWSSSRRESSPQIAARTRTTPEGASRRASMPAERPEMVNHTDGHGALPPLPSRGRGSSLPQVGGGGGYGVESNADMGLAPKGPDVGDSLYCSNPQALALAASKSKKGAAAAAGGGAGGVDGGKLKKTLPAAGAAKAATLDTSNMTPAKMQSILEQKGQKPTGVGQ
jgi:hypothetical protein